MVHPRASRARRATRLRPSGGTRVRPRRADHRLRPPRRDLQAHSPFTRQLDRALRLLANDARPIQVVIAGKAHPQDDEAKQALQAVMALRRAPRVGSRMVFLDDYDLHMARVLVAGADLWVNLPRPPLEASGTSGMKAAPTEALHLSVLDGWWVEGYDGDNGWTLHTPAADPDAQDDHDATVLIRSLLEVIPPSFYDRDAAGLPAAWLALMRASLRTNAPEFSATRMLRDYGERIYG